MKLRIGDKVRFLNETGEGVVSRIKDKTMVFVEMQDGFEIPFAANQLVVIHTELILDKNTGNSEMDPESTASDAVYFVVEPDHELPSLMNDYRVYLFNASSYPILFTYSVKDENYFQTIKHGEAGPYQKILLKTIKPGFFNEFNYHKVECLFFNTSYFKAQSPIAEVVYITPQLLLKLNTMKHDEFKKPVHTFLLKDNFISVNQVEQDLSPMDIEKLKTVKEFNSVSKTSKSNKQYLLTLEKEVDLHMEELVDSLSGLGKHDMLTIQLKKFEKELDKAIEMRMKKITFIHGLGNGRLKHEIILKLRSMKGITFHDASYKEYGYGATQVNIL